MQHECIKCRKVFPRKFQPFCDACGGMVEVRYDLIRVQLYDSENPYERFRSLLPVEDAGLLPRSAEYTPCIHAEKLGDHLGMPWLFLKNETVLPTGTTKDRMAAVSLPFLWECGVRAFCTSSTGNSSTAYAHRIGRFPEMRMVLFTAEAFRERVNCGESGQVAPFILRGASFVDAFQCASALAGRLTLTAERGFFNPGRREGLKLAFMEATDQVDRPIDWYVQAISSAMGVQGTFKGCHELQEIGHIQYLPRLLCVQQDTCAPMVRAYEDGSHVIRPEHIVHSPTGIAKSILRGDPTRAYPYVRQIVDESDGGFVVVSETEIREARRMVEELEGVSICFSAAAAMAGLVRRVRRGEFPTCDTVLVNLTGRDREHSITSTRAHWLIRDGDGWAPEDPSLDLEQRVWGKQGAPSKRP